MTGGKVSRISRQAQAGNSHRGFTDLQREGQGKAMNRILTISLAGLMCAGLSTATKAQDKSQDAAPPTTQVHLVITDAAAQENAELPRLQKENVEVKQGKNRLEVTQLIPAQGENAALQLMILIDDTIDPRIGNNLNDLKEFIQAQPASTLIGIGYISNTTFNIAQNFTQDHDLAVKAIRLPLGRLSTADSPYLSLISLVKSWPQQKVRREVLMFTDGIDRFRGETPEVSMVDRQSFAIAYHSMPTISQDATIASEISQKLNVLVYSIFAVGVGRAGRTEWDMNLGISGLTKIADETGGECFSLGNRNLVSFKPYLDQFQKLIDNQYYLVFAASAKKKAGLQRIKIQTELTNSEILAPDNVWVEAAPK
jgi:hypothetical protein